MKNFVLGIVATLLVLVIGAFAYLRLGLIDTRASLEPSSTESGLAMSFLDASVDRHASEIRMPIESNPAVLTDGVKIYRQSCSGCHGDPAHPQSALLFYPRAPQFMKDAPDMPPNQNFYIIKYGVRWTGMPAWEGVLSDAQIWKVVAFLSKMDHLPPGVEEQWKATQSRGN